MLLSRTLRFLLPTLLFALPSAASAQVPRYGLGVQIGALFHHPDLEPSALATPFAGLEASLVLPQGGGRLRPLVSLTRAQMATDGEASDPRVFDGAYTWTLDEHMTLLGVGLTARPLDQKWNFQIEGRLAPQLVWTNTVTQSASSEGDFGSSTSRFFTVGLLAALGFALNTDLGEFTLTGSGTAVPVRGDLSGKGFLTGVAPTLGYRYWF
ncbi:MAG: hypothetical protein JXB39_00070 [Deltaproteobacteria bacterium]|nr:hypothetical protein [Deltaproteobacteria bacterium]